MNIEFGEQPPIKKKSPYNPFITALQLENLPSAVLAHQLTNILSRVPGRNGVRMKRPDHGVSM